MASACITFVSMMYQCLYLHHMLSCCMLLPYATACWSFAAAHVTYLEARAETRHIDSAAHCRSPPLTHQLLMLLYLLRMHNLITDSNRLSIWRSPAPMSQMTAACCMGSNQITATCVAIFSIRSSDPICYSCCRASFQVACILPSIHRG